MKQSLSLSVIIPTFNNEKTIERVVEDSVRVVKKFASYEIIVLNDGSIDKTGAILQNLARKNTCIHIITHEKNRGYGQTIKELYNHARSDWLFSVPGDYQILPGELTKLLPYRDNADMIIGWRVHRHDPENRLVQSKFYNWVLRCLFDLSLRDVNSVRLMKTSLLKKISLSSHSAFVDAELAIQATRAGFRIIEVPIAHRQEKKKGSGGSLRTIVPTIADMIDLWISDIIRQINKYYK